MQFTIKIDAMYVSNTQSLADIINVVKWTYTLTDDSGNTLSFTLDTALSPPDENNFIQYESLTEQQVIDWISSSVDLSDLQLRLQINLAESLSAPTNKPLPW